MNVIFEPNSKYLKQIESWLLDEKNAGKSGFYYNFINADFSNNNFICLVDDFDQAIGFINYTFNGKYSSIDVAVIRNEYQKKGYGKFLLDKLSESLLERGTLVLKLYCEPSSSKKVWLKLGFKVFKEVENHRFLNSKNFPHPWLYKILVPILATTKKRNIETRLELWTEFERKVKEGVKPNYVWDVTNYSLPIIYPVDGEWKIRLIVNNEIKYEGLTKRFCGDIFTIGYFLLIDRKFY